MYKIIEFNFIKVNWEFVQNSNIRVFLEFTNFTIFGPNVVQHEIKMIVNIGNRFWMVIRHYPWYINDCNSHFQYLLL